MRSRDADYRACLADGMTMHQTAKALGVSRPAVHGWAKKNKVRFANGRASATRAEDERILWVLANRQVGATDEQIGRLIKVTKSGVHLMRKRIEDADVAYAVMHGDDAAQVRAAYR